jgi:hypothetical protein
METRELRLGNWVLTPDGSVQITDIFNGGINLSDDKYEAYPDYSMDQVSPIPLTPEILEAAGFEKGCLTKRINEDWFIYYNDGMWLQVEKQGKRDYICERISQFHIKYVHQLQNYFHALTGSELTINLTEKVNV